MSNTIEEQWERFHEQVLAGVPEKELFRAKICFYAGATQLLNMQRMLSAKSIMPEEASIQFVSWLEECNDFGNQVLTGAKEMLRH